MLRKQVTSIGRSTNNDIVIDIPEVSRNHARIEYRDGRFYLVDLGSTNGTIVNGKKISSTVIEDDDAITLGTANLEFISYRTSVGR